MQSPAPKPTEMPPIRSWLAVFADAETEQAYRDSTWNSAYRKYLLLFILGAFIMLMRMVVLWATTDMAPVGLVIQHLLLAAIFAVPLLLRDRPSFQRRHDLVSGCVLVVLQATNIAILTQRTTPMVEVEIMASMIVVVLIYAVMPFGVVVAAMTTALTLSFHFMAIIFVPTTAVGEAVLSDMALPFSLLATAIAWIAMANYHSELEVLRRKQFAQLRLLEKQRATIRESFDRYMGGKVADSILSEQVELTGESRWVTILFTDLRGYSTIIEPMAPKQVLALLNEYYTEMQPIIEKHDGVVLEYIGDAMMVVFGAPKDVEKHQRKAVQCAQEMRARMTELNRRWEKKGMDRFWKNQDIEVLWTRAGIHTGHIVAGNIGSDKRSKYGAIGDVVNIAARLEQANKSLNTDILFSRSVFVALPHDLAAEATDQGPMALKGRSGEERVYSV